MGAAVLAGAASIFGWLIGGFCVIILALIHAELGGMYPVAGGTARFPHLAYGSVAGISFGFFSWLQAVTVAPIECFAVMQYAQYYCHGLYNPAKGVTTASGFIWTIVLMAMFTVLNFLAVRLFARVNNAITWWKVAIPILTIIIFFKFHASNFTACRRLLPGERQDAVRHHPRGRHRVLLPGVRASRPARGRDQGPAAQPAARGDHRVPVGTAIYILCALTLMGAVPPSELTHGFIGLSSTNPVTIYPFAAVAGLAGLGFWATILHIDAFISPFGTGMIYQTSTSRVGYGLARNRYYPQIFQWTDRNGVPWFSLLMAFAFGLLFLLPFPSWKSLVGLVTSASVLMYAGAPLSLTAFRKRLPEASRPYRMPAAWFISPLGSLICSFLIYWSGFETVWKLGICLVIGYVLIGVVHGLRPAAAAAGLEVRAVAAVLPARHGHHLLAGAVRAGQHLPDPVRLGLRRHLVFTLVIYYWAVAVALPRDEMQRLVALQSSRMADVPDTPRH